MRIWRERETKKEKKRRGGYGWDGGGRYSEVERIRQTEQNVMVLMGCQSTVYMEFLLGVELPRHVERHPSVSLSACLCFRNSLCSSLESLYFLSPWGAPGAERARKWGYLSTLYNGVHSQQWEEKNKDEINHSSLVPSPFSHPSFPHFKFRAPADFLTSYI